MELKVALAQIKVVSGDLEGNTNRILEGIQKAIDEKVDIVVFPETAITHYCCGDLFFHDSFIDKQLDYLYNKIIPFTIGQNICVVLGFIDKRGKSKDDYPILYNSCGIIQDGKMEIYDKILLAKRGQHEDVRYFEPGSKIKSFNLIKKDGEIIKWSPIICQDMWSNECDRDIVKECVDNGSQLVIVINQSYFHFGKQDVRKKIISDHCVSNNISMVYLNAVAVGDITKNIMIYNGGSFACNTSGNILVECNNFKEDFKICNIEDTIPKSNDALNSRINLYTKKNLSKHEKYEEIFNALSF